MIMSLSLRYIGFGARGGEGGMRPPPSTFWPKGGKGAASF